MLGKVTQPPPGGAWQWQNSGEAAAASYIGCSEWRQPLGCWENDGEGWSERRRTAESDPEHRQQKKKEEEDGGKMTTHTHPEATLSTGLARS